MGTKEFSRRVRRAFSDGVTGKEAFDLELEAHADQQARQILEQAEDDDRHMLRLRAALQPPQPWYRSTPFAMAASAVLAAGLTLLVTTPTTRAPGTGMASTAVYYLESTRSAAAADLPELVVGSEQDWVTLMLYPAYDDYTEFVVDVRKLGSTDSDQSHAGTGSTVWSHTLEAGAGDELAITLRRSVLEDGIYRVNVSGVAREGGRPVLATSLRFIVVTAAGPRS